MLGRRCRALQLRERSLPEAESKTTAKLNWKAQHKGFRHLPPETPDAIHHEQAAVTCR